MNILITGAKGFVGRNLYESLKTIMDGRNKTRPGLHIEEIFEYISTHNKILSFTYSNKDSSLPYIEKYPNGLIIEEDNVKLQENAEAINSFLTAEAKATADSELCAIFEKTHRSIFVKSFWRFKMKISVIIPVYNAEKYLEKCIQSILNQTFTDFELILINDGSVDNSDEICLSFAARDKRIKYIKTENGGAARARNTGIEVSGGEYLVFIDCDDAVKPDYLERLYCAVTESNADMVVCGMNKYSKGRLLHCPNKEEIYSKCEYILAVFYGKIVYVTAFGPCSKIISARVIKENNIRFPNEYKLSEDRIFNLDVMGKAEKVATIGYSGYCYNENPDSLTHNKGSKAILKNIILAETTFHEKAEALFKNNGLLKENESFLLKERLKALLSFGAQINRLKEKDTDELYSLALKICSVEQLRGLKLKGFKWKILESIILKESGGGFKKWIKLMEMKNKLRR